MPVHPGGAISLQGVCDRFAAERREGRRYRSTAAAAERPGAAALISKCEQCHVDS